MFVEHRERVIDVRMLKLKGKGYRKSRKQSHSILKLVNSKNDITYPRTGFSMREPRLNLVDSTLCPASLERLLDLSRVVIVKVVARRKDLLQLLLLKEYLDSRKSTHFRQQSNPFYRNPIF
jgi:hypothetical protein